MAKKEKTEAPKKEHKKNWREVYASVEDIERYLSDHVQLRKNVISCRVECHLLNRNPWESYDGSEESAMDLLMAMNNQQQSVDETPTLWRPIDDRIVNSLWKDFSKQKPVRIQDIYHILDSDFVPEFNPFRHYLDHLPPWDGESNHILAMSASVQVKGGVDEQMLFYKYLQKWLVAMVAGWVDDNVVNNVILVLIGEQGSYKTTWFNYLLPPELKQYFYTKTNANRMGRDDLLALAQYGLVCCEELDTMKPSELNQLKAVVTMPFIDERAAYAHFHEHRAHIASFCGTGNNVQFLSDATGNRRWLPFEIESIDSPRENPFDYAAIYAQAYGLYRQGFRYWFSQAEIQQLAGHNEAFMSSATEFELVKTFFRKPEHKGEGDFTPVSAALQLISCRISGSIVARLNAVLIGRAFTQLGFDSKIRHGLKGYIAVKRDDGEVKEYLNSLIDKDESEDEPF